MHCSSSSRRWRPFWPPFPQQHAQWKVRSADSSSWRLNFETPWSNIDSIASLSSVLSALMESSHFQQYRQDDWHFRTMPWKEELFLSIYVLDDIETVDRIKGPFTQAIFVAATRWNFCCAKIASSFKHVRNPCDIAATNHTENRTWFTRAILELQL